MALTAPVIDVIPVEIDGLPDTEIKVLEGEWEALSKDTIQSKDGEKMITVHLSELAFSNLDILVVLNIVGSGIWCTGGLSKIESAKHNINIFIRDVVNKVNEIGLASEDIRQGIDTPA